MESMCFFLFFRKFDADLKIENPFYTLMAKNFFRIMNIVRMNF